MQARDRRKHNRYWDVLCPNATTHLFGTELMSKETPGTPGEDGKPGTVNVRKALWHSL